MSTSEEMHFNDKTPFILSMEPWREPKKKSKDVISVTLDDTWSQMRTEALGRAVWHYVVLNETKAHQYDTEFFVGIHGEPCAVCNCPSAVVCKHILHAMAHLLANENEEFGLGFESEVINKVRELIKEGA